MSGKHYIGIDPGASGGLAVIYPDGTVTLQPLGGMTFRDIWQWFYDEGGAEDSLSSPLTFAVLEKVGGFMAGGGGDDGWAKKNVASATNMFAFGAGFGRLQMCLVAAGIPNEEVTPQKWMRGLGIPPRKAGSSKTEWKNVLKAWAVKLFPGEKVTLATCDALLIAEYCRRTHS